MVIVIVQFSVSEEYIKILKYKASVTPHWVDIMDRTEQNILLAFAEMSTDTQRIRQMLSVLKKDIGRFCSVSIHFAIRVRCDGLNQKQRN